uniref:Uncharacterized protein n=1 Tax=Macrostomum lignano TaxID=282301 RepID=A0A1I8FGE4_9PLAT
MIHDMRPEIGQVCQVFVCPALGSLSHSRAASGSDCLVRLTRFSFFHCSTGVSSTIRKRDKQLTLQGREDFAASGSPGSWCSTRELFSPPRSGEAACTTWQGDEAEVRALRRASQHRMGDVGERGLAQQRRDGR